MQERLIVDRLFTDVQLMEGQYVDPPHEVYKILYRKREIIIFMD